jgi:hypothetical protein
MTGSLILACLAPTNNRSIITKANKKIIGFIYCRQAAFKEISRFIFHSSAWIDITIRHYGKQFPPGGTSIGLLERQGKKLQAPGKGDPVSRNRIKKIDDNGKPQQPNILSNFSRAKREALFVAWAWDHPICPEMMNIQSVAEEGQSQEILIILTGCRKGHRCSDLCCYQPLNAQDSFLKTSLPSYCFMRPLHAIQADLDIGRRIFFKQTDTCRINTVPIRQQAITFNIPAVMYLFQQGFKMAKEEGFSSGYREMNTTLS